MRAVEPSYTHERKEDGVGERQKRGTRCACAASMVWGVCELRGVGQVFTHVGMKAHVWRARADANWKKNWTFSKQKEDESEHVASLLQPPPLMCACFFFISSVRSARNEKKVFFSKMVLAQHSHPHPRHSTCSALASWARSGSLPLGTATFHSLCLFVCPHLSISLNLSYLVLRVLVRACRQEELHGGGVTVGRGTNESRGANLYMRGKRME